MPQRVTQAVAEVALTSDNPAVRVTQSVVEAALTSSLPESRVYQLGGLLLIEVNAEEVFQTGVWLPSGLFPAGEVQASIPDQVIAGSQALQLGIVFGPGAAAPSREIVAGGTVALEARFGSGAAVPLLQDVRPAAAGSGAGFGVGMIDMPRIERGVARVPLSVEWLHRDRLLSGWTLQGGRIQEPVYSPVLYFSGGEETIELVLRSTAWRRSSNERIELLELHADCGDEESSRLLLEEWVDEGSGLAVSFDSGRSWMPLRRSSPVRLTGLALDASSQIPVLFRIAAPSGQDGVLRTVVRISAVWRAS